MKPDPSELVGPLDEVIRVSAEAHGQDISRYEDAFLRKMIAKRTAATGIQDMAAYGEHLEKFPAEAEIFFRSLRINHSDFFRNPLSFAVLEQVVLPGLVDAKKKSGGREIRVWSAGCAAGQEAWSLAMLLEGLTGSQEGPSYRLLATDLDGPDLTLARAGVYGAEAVGNIRTRHLNDYFSRRGDSFSIVPPLRARADFSVYDLLDGSSGSPAAGIYGDFDLILCCNVLFYYRAEARRHILDKICHALSPGGYFVTGEVERGISLAYSGLRAMAPPAAVFQKPK